MVIGSFNAHDEDLNNQFPDDIEAAVNAFKASGVTNLVIDVTNNNGS